MIGFIWTPEAFGLLEFWGSFIRAEGLRFRFSDLL